MPLLLVAMHLLPYCSFNMLRTVCFLFPFHHQAGKTFGLLAWLHVHAVVRRGSAHVPPLPRKRYTVSEFYGNASWWVEVSTHADSARVGM